MLGPIMKLMALAQQQQDMQMPQRPAPYQSIFQQYLDRMNQPDPSRGAFRDPSQMGPSPPTGGPITAMFRGTP